MNAINFGSGWWPTIRKRPGHSGYGTMAAGVTRALRVDGAVDRRRAAGDGRGDDRRGGRPRRRAPADGAVRRRAARRRRPHPLDHGGRFLGPAEAAGLDPRPGSDFAAWDSFADVSSYDGREVPFFKRAQLAAADLHRAGVADLPGLDRLTAFADNLVPHVLRVDGVLHLDPDLTARIEAEELLEHGSPEEVELRACAVHAVELLAAANPLTPAEIDSALWNRGRAARYKSLPRPRSRNTRLLRICTVRAATCTLVSMANPARRVNVTLDEEHAQRLALLAARTHIQEGTLARSLLSSALDQVDPGPARVTEILESIPGAWERTQEGLAQAARGEGKRLDELA